MQTLIDITFHEMDSSPAFEERILRHVVELEERFGRIISGRVVVTGPGERHRTGGLYDVRIHLSLPEGREVHVDRLSHDDERYADVGYAINDTFKRARRQLQDEVRKLHGDVKRHEPEPHGRVLRIDPNGDFGFIETSDGREIYFHRNSVLNDGFARLEPGAPVTFAEEMGEKGPQASTVKPMGKRGMV
ncbi:HPF/RaiA family ribosome-associated protein [Lutibaculum baratangense]|uniref:Cold shock domain family protein n=1 Tax=Lutibaculum baratangense AMV1 TaxID=631454 RepID=V4RH70_9HYPH|nr:HPF/RaiA family ribosome-associated protein [Lutibaculum baratangense]ESR25466.1 cold shock domain family protein [Lutibaculum baratangense AMV1]